MKRRTFLSYSALAAAPLLLPNFHLPLSAARASKRKLVMLHLKGGNDGFNTIVPYQNHQYYQARPTLAIAAHEVIKLNNNFGLNPALKPLQKHFAKGNMLIINNVSSTEIDSSHFSATQLWENGSNEATSTWIDRHCQQCSENNILSESLAYTDEDFITGMQSLALTINQNPEAQIYRVSLDGFDTHQFQKSKHDHLLDIYAKGIDHLLTALETNGELKHTMVITWSEFGRQLKENNKKGTEHGDSNSLLIYGGALKTPGVWESNSDSIIDFRQVHSTIAKNWLNTPNNLFDKFNDPMPWV